MLIFRPSNLPILALLTQSLSVFANDACGEVTWVEKDLRGNVSAATDLPFPMRSVRVERETTDVQPGDFVCRLWYPTTEIVDSYTCTRLCKLFEIDLITFFSWNPTVLHDCSNIQPLTEYCVAGFIEPLRAWDGLCGPRHNNATCFGTNKPCCNAKTFTCGDSDEDCADGTCYEGRCWGDKIYSTDGTCGYEHGGRRCAGKWGSCCNMSGACGNGTDFCGESVCQSGKCDWKNPSKRSSTTSTSRPSGPMSTFKPGSAETINIYV